MTIRPAVEPQHVRWMAVALDEARKSLRTEDVPVGAVLVGADGSVLATGRNRREVNQDPTGHAEMEALRAAASLTGSWQLPGSTLVVTLEPCVMCAGAILAARVDRVVFGAWDDKAGAAGSVYDVLRDRRLPHRVEVISDVLAEECSGLLLDFFRERRDERPR